MSRYKAAIISTLVLCWAATGLAQSNITLKADADTYISEHQSGSSFESAVLQVRSRAVVGSGRQYITYVRFDLNVLQEAPVSNAVFTVFNQDETPSTIGSTQILVYGLKNMAGNTPQAWDEAITYDGSGDEVPGDGDATTQDLATNRVEFLGYLPGQSNTATNGNPLAFSNAALLSFLTNRYADDGLVTLMLVEADGTDKELYLHQSESAFTNFVPILDVIGTYTGPPVDTNPPMVAATSPTNGATNVSVSTEISVTFSEPMDEATITSTNIALYDASTNEVTTTLSYGGGTAILYPHGWLDGNSSYSVVVKGGAGGVADTNNNEMVADYIFSFDTGDTPVLSLPLSLGPDADTWLSNGSGSGPTATHGTESLVQIRWHAVRIRMGYVRFDINGINSAAFSGATLSGTFNSASYNNPGSWDVWGLDDSTPGAFWSEADTSYSTAAGVVNDAPLNTFGITNATHLGTIIVDGYDPTNGTLPVFISDTTNLPLGTFLAEDTDGVVTFIIMSTTANGNEYRLDSKEGDSSGYHGPIKLNFPDIGTPPMAATIHTFTPGAGTVSLTWNAISNHAYSVERTLSLAPASWIALSTNEVTNTFTDTAPPADEAFYRVGDSGESP